MVVYHDLIMIFRARRTGTVSWPGSDWDGSKFSRIAAREIGRTYTYFVMGEGRGIFRNPKVQLHLA